MSQYLDSTLGYNILNECNAGCSGRQDGRPIVDKQERKYLVVRGITPIDPESKEAAVELFWRRDSFQNR